jgi:hypothetical protein
MDNVQKRNICTDVPLSQTFRQFSYNFWTPNSNSLISVATNRLSLYNLGSDPMKNTVYSYRILLCYIATSCSTVHIGQQILLFQRRVTIQLHSKQSWRGPHRKHLFVTYCYSRVFTALSSVIISQYFGKFLRAKRLAASQVILSSMELVS